MSENVCGSESVSIPDVTYFIFCVLRQIVERRDVQLELSALAKLSKARPQADKVRS